MNPQRGCVPGAPLSLYGVRLRYCDRCVIVLMPATSIVSALEAAVKASPGDPLCLESWNAREIGLVFESDTSRIARAWLEEFSSDGLIALDPTEYLGARVQ